MGRQEGSISLERKEREKDKKGGRGEIIFAVFHNGIEETKELEAPLP